MAAKSHQPPAPPMTLGNLRGLGVHHPIGARQFPRATDLFVPRPKPRPYRVVRAYFVRLRPQPTFDRHAQGTSAIRDPHDYVFSSRVVRTAALSPDMPVLVVSLFIDPFPNGPGLVAVLGWGQDGNA
jgi:hypothetical protein